MKENVVRQQMSLIEVATLRTMLRGWDQLKRVFLARHVSRVFCGKRLRFHYNRYRFLKFVFSTSPTRVNATMSMIQGHVEQESRRPLRVAIL